MVKFKSQKFMFRLLENYLNRYDVVCILSSNVVDDYGLDYVNYSFLLSEGKVLELKALISESSIIPLFSETSQFYLGNVKLSNFDVLLTKCFKMYDSRQSWNEDQSKKNTRVLRGGIRPLIDTLVLQATAMLSPLVGKSFGSEYFVSSIDIKFVESNLMAQIVVFKNNIFIGVEQFWLHKANVLSLNLENCDEEFCDLMFDFGIKVVLA